MAKIDPQRLIKSCAMPIVLAEATRKRKLSQKVKYWIHSLFCLNFVKKDLWVFLSHKSKYEDVDMPIPTVR